MLKKLNEVLDGKKTYITAIIGLVVLPFADKLTGLNAGGVVKALVLKACSSEFCLTVADSLAGATQEIYLAAVAALVVYFRSKAIK